MAADLTYNSFALFAPYLKVEDPEAQVLFRAIEQEIETDLATPMPLSGHTGAVECITAVTLPDGRVLVATGSHDATVRLWDPATATPVGDRVRAGPACVRLPRGRCSQTIPGS